MSKVLLSTSILILTLVLFRIFPTPNGSEVTDYSVDDKYYGLSKAEYPDRAAYYEQPVDIDDEGQDEIVFYTNMYMTKRPHKAYIVKDGVIVFESDEKANVSLYEAKDGKGFYLKEQKLINAQPKTVVTRYY